VTETSPTLAQVAAHAGVSLATASRALNGSTRRVNPDLLEKVTLSAVALGYSPNASAQAVARGTSDTVALLVGDIADPYFAEIASGVIRVADERRLVVTITAVGSNDGRGLAEREFASLAAVRRQRPRAILLAASRTTGAAARDLGAAPGLVVVGSDVPGVASLVVDNRNGAAHLADELIRLGYTEFVVLAGQEELVTARERAEGFASRADVRQVVHSEFSRDGAYGAMTRLLGAGERPQCVFAVTDVMALGAMAAIRDGGLVPGSDVAVAGFDDIALLRDVSPRLTSVALPLAEIGARALRLALDGDLAGPDAEPIEGRVHLRDSTPSLRR